MGTARLQNSQKPIIPVINQLSLKDRRKTIPASRMGEYSPLSSQILCFSHITKKTCLLCNVSGLVATNGAGRQVTCILFSPATASLCDTAKLTLNASRTMRAITVMIAGTSHYCYLWFLNTGSYKTCTKHRGRHLHYCIIAQVLKPGFLLQFQSGQVSLKNPTSNLSGISIGIFSSTLPFSSHSL